MESHTDIDLQVENARRQWGDGERRVQALRSDRSKGALAEAVVEAMLSELERRVGQTFTLAELAGEYNRAESWAMPVAHHVAPEQPWAWDLALVLDAACHRYARGAQDYQP